MSPRTRFWLLLPIILIPGVLLSAAGFYWLRHGTAGDTQFPPLLFLLAAWLVLSILVVSVWVLLDRALLRPLQNLGENLETISHTGTVPELKLPAFHLLGELPAAAHELAGQLYSSRREAAQALESAGQTAQKQETDNSARGETQQEQYEQILNKLLKTLRRPIANLRATAEVLDAYPQMEKTVRRNFYRIILEELRNVDEQAAEAWQARTVLSKSRLHMRNISAAALLHKFCAHADKAYSLQNCCQEPAPRLHVDSHTFLLLLEYLLCRIKQHLNVQEFQTACTAEDGHVYMDISWHGEMLSNSLLEQWLDNAIDSCLPAAIMPRDILEAHDCDVWSASTSRADFTCLRLSVPPVHTQESDAL